MCVCKIFLVRVTHFWNAICLWVGCGLYLAFIDLATLWHLAAKHFSAGTEDQRLLSLVLEALLPLCRRYKTKIDRWTTSLFITSKHGTQHKQRKRTLVLLYCPCLAWLLNCSHKLMKHCQERWEVRGEWSLFGHWAQSPERQRWCSGRSSKQLQHRPGGHWLDPYWQQQRGWQGLPLKAEVVGRPRNGGAGPQMQGPGRRHSVPGWVSPLL